MTGKKSPLRGKFRGLITAIYNRHCVRSNLDFTLRRVVLAVAMAVKLK